MPCKNCIHLVKSELGFRCAFLRIWRDLRSEPVYSWCFSENNDLSQSIATAAPVVKTEEAINHSQIDKKEVKDNTPVNTEDIGEMPISKNKHKVARDFAPGTLFRCAKCHQVKPIEEFAIHNRHKVYMRVCKECYRERQAEALKKARGYRRGYRISINEFSDEELLTELKRRLFTAHNLTVSTEKTDNHKVE